MFAFLLNDKDNSPNYVEFSVKKMALKFNEYQQISKFIPYYLECQLQEKDYYYMIVCSLYPHMMDDLIFLAYG